MITDTQFHRIVTYTKGRYGIDLSEKRHLVNGRLETYIVRNGYDGFDDFMAKVNNDPNGKEAGSLINILTTNHTYFWREPIHFEFMKKVALPFWESKLGNTKDLRVWCGASSTGEEPYTLAMIMMDYFGYNHSKWDTKILATDISTRVLEHAVKGVYLKEEIEPLQANWRRRFFKQINEDEYQVTPELKGEVIYRRFNLMDPMPFKRKFHVVFLRNVMIYFKDDVKYALVNRIYDQMEPGGYLFIGLTESLDRNKICFQYIQPAVYRKV